MSHYPVPTHEVATVTGRHPAERCFQLFCRVEFLDAAPTRMRERRTTHGLALPSQGIDGILRFSPVNHHCKGREVMHERMSGNHFSSSKTFTARRCPVVSSGASMTVGRRPGPPVEVRTSVALMPARLSSIFLTDTSGARAILARLTNINPRTVANVCSRIDPSAHWCDGPHGTTPPFLALRNNSSTFH